MVGHLNDISIMFFGNFFNIFLYFIGERHKFDQINFSEDDHKWFGLEQGLDVLEKLNLLIDSVTTSFRNVNKEENASIQVSKSSNGLHFYCVSLFKRMVK